MGDVSEVTFRRAVPTDLSQIRELYRQLDDLHAVAEPALIPPFEDEQRPDETILGHIAATDPPFFVAVDQPSPSGDDERVTGFVRIVVRHLGPGFVVPSVPDEEELVVLDRERGRGIGRALMRAAEGWALTEGYPELWVTAWSFNEPAAGLYRSEGFVPLSTRFRKALSRKPEAP